MTVNAHCMKIISIFTAVVLTGCASGNIVPAASEDPGDTAPIPAGWGTKDPAGVDRLLYKLEVERGFASGNPAIYFQDPEGNRFDQRAQIRIIRETNLKTPEPIFFQDGDPKEIKKFGIPFDFTARLYKQTSSENVERWYFIESVKPRPDKATRCFSIRADGREVKGDLADLQPGDFLRMFQPNKAFFKESQAPLIKKAIRERLFNLQGCYRNSAKDIELSLAPTAAQ